MTGEFAVYPSLRGEVAFVSGGATESRAGTAGQTHYSAAAPR